MYNLKTVLATLLITFFSLCSFAQDQKFIDNHADSLTNTFYNLKDVQLRPSAKALVYEMSQVYVEDLVKLANKIPDTKSQKYKDRLNDIKYSYYSELIEYRTAESIRGGLSPTHLSDLIYDRLNKHTTLIFSQLEP